MICSFLESKPLELLAEVQPGAVPRWWGSRGTLRRRESRFFVLHSLREADLGFGTLPGPSEGLLHFWGLRHLFFAVLNDMCRAWYPRHVGFLCQCLEKAV